MSQRYCLFRDGQKAGNPIFPILVKEGYPTFPFDHNSGLQNCMICSGIALIPPTQAAVFWGLKGAVGVPYPYSDFFGDFSDSWKVRNGKASP